MLNREAKEAGASEVSRFNTKGNHLGQKNSDVREQRYMRPHDRPHMGKYASQYPTLHIYGSREHNDQLENALDNRKEENMDILTVGPVELGEEGKMVARYPPTMSLMPKLNPDTFSNDWNKP